MKPWHEARPETKQLVVFPPRGQEASFAASKERIGAYLRQAFPGLEFELADAGLYEDASVMPMCGTAGDGEVAFSRRRPRRGFARLRTR